MVSGVASRTGASGNPENGMLKIELNDFVAIFTRGVPEFSRLNAKAAKVVPFHLGYAAWRADTSLAGYILGLKLRLQNPSPGLDPQQKK